MLSPSFQPSLLYITALKRKIHLRLITAEMGSALRASLILCLVIAAAPLSCSANSNAGQAASAKQVVFKPMFVLIGDSITEYGFEAPHGWALQLSAKYSRRADIINRGFGGTPNVHVALFGCIVAPDGARTAVVARKPLGSDCC